MVLGAAVGKSYNALAADLRTSRPTVIEWRRRSSAKDGGVGKGSVQRVRRANGLNRLRENSLF
jgi:hypothetical protein